MNPANAIEVEHLTKEFRVYHRAYGTLKAQTVHVLQRLMHRDIAASFSLRRALNDVSFDVPKGQAVALIGHNGSGKSTLLSILTRIYLPSQGEIRMRGRVSSLLELGVGFNPELTGIENVFFSGALRGLADSEIAQRYPSIVEFAELDDETMDLPTRMYSSGMSARLAFAVAINIDSEILLIDEALAVGDINFQEKCLAKLQEYKAEGRTIFLVTHDHNFVERFADRAIWLDHGNKHMDGTATEIVPKFRDFMLRPAAAATPS